MISILTLFVVDQCVQCGFMKKHTTSKQPQHLNNIFCSNSHGPRKAW